MSIVIYTKSEKHSLKWKGVLQKELPESRIEVYPEISHFDAVEFLICWKPYRGLIDRFRNLKAIQSLGAGVDHIFEQNDIPSNIQVSKVVDHQLTQDMWEHVLSIVLADMKNLSLYDDQQQIRKWKPKRYKRIKDVTIGILGLGRIGSYVASQFSKLGFQVLGWSRSMKNFDDVISHEGNEGLDAVLQNSDYLINILPLTDETKGLLNGENFAKMKPSSYVINVGRGQHLVEGELIKCVDNEEIRGASLDVFDTEPLPDSHAFWLHKKIKITPHIASLTHIDSVYPQVVENYNRLISGKPLLHRIDVEKGY